MVKEPSRDGKSTFVVVPRDTKGMRGKQDPYSMLELDKSGKIVKDYGSHPSLAGATKFVKSKAANRDVGEEVEVSEAPASGNAIVIEQVYSLRCSIISVGPRCLPIVLFR